MCSKGEENYLRDSALMLECNIDDMNPEIYSYVMDKLFSIGVSDVYFTNIMMKKGRPAIKVSVLCPCDLEHRAIEILFKETSTLGIRKYYIEKNLLKREMVKVDTKHGSIRLKKAYYGNTLIKNKFEFEDCKKIAEKNGIPLTKLYDDIRGYEEE